ncbi:ExeM/NucH family extracellular endonuclease [Marinobacter bohaiensis]|uniref:ExeM/NucH family extracellular endonuclease n=1 Tax=Marinobacter bohaiensis TaxID=2201898 RepID=UPI000DABCBD1|nr:ExeM/NucH family extracellular endonuclease [Marinobacter bohaiensis]
MTRNACRLFALMAGLLPAIASAQCGTGFTPISSIQGSDDESPLAGRTVTVEGIITLDGRGEDGLGGFYLESAAADRDHDARTSEGLYIYTRSRAGAVGERVRVRGRIKEYYGLTEMAANGDLDVCGRGELPAAISLAFPLPASLESRESMRVRFDNPLVVIDNHDLARYGIVSLAPQDAFFPDPGARSERNTLLLDDRRLAQNPAILPLPVPGLSAGRSLRAGSRLAPVQGILDFRYDQWRIQPDRWPAVVGGYERPPAPPAPADGAIRVASFNVLNFFNGDGRGGGFPTARGADTLDEMERQRAKLVSAILGLHADVVGLMEIENDGHGRDSALADLTRALGDGWDYVRAPDAGGDAIRVALVFRADRVEPAGSPASLTDGVFGRYSRAPLLQDFRRIGQGRIRVVVNHFKSRSCRNASGANQAQGSEGCYAPVREASATTLLDWLARRPQPSSLAGTLVLGDLNTYAGERPLQRLASGGLQRPAPLAGDQRYSYRYFGARGLLDYILADASARDRVSGGGIWHINADEPPALDYNLEYHPPGRAERLYSEGPWRASDHDPVYLDLTL